ncbi:MAG: hypothetical protein ACJA2N_000615 [Salibacteraceae bacterium]|jgi:hypothetical protein
MNQPQLIDFPKIQDPRGNLTFFQNSDQIPFDIERVFWTYDVPGGEVRGGHAFKTQQEVIIALSGAFDVIVINAVGNEERYHLNRSYFGLYLPPNTWRHIDNFSTNALALHVSDQKYDAADYIRSQKDLPK